MAQETIKIAKTPITVNTTGPVPDSSAQAKPQPLPVVRPVHNYTGPTPVVENTVTTQQSTATDNQNTSFNPENTPVNNPIVNNPAGGPLVSKKTKKLPPFTPVTNKTGPVKTE